MQQRDEVEVTAAGLGYLEWPLEWASLDSGLRL